MNLANKLTLIRILLVPIFLVFIVAKGIPYGTFIATFIFILASLTDKLDGYIARSRNQITNFGKFMDPLADKLLVTAALVSLVELGLVQGWAAIIIIAREFAVSGLRTLAASEGKIIAASWWGKIKTVIQIIAIILLLIEVNISTSTTLIKMVANSKVLEYVFTSLPTIMMNIAVIITVVSGWDYFRKNKGVISTNK
ncbi:CDP-diacylglycerol--glycerol-3-phosphate 3-phosphatidyltransferase [Clostridium thermobutyricum]|uniref:CDP-diacylglycerol--glycerol-3-phosphate 3-phosphatidyltransferase n=1 Tax=Clostridium thermobutyricum DSM 4928 TaxID=1121339 RepID=A0A1V4SVR4_9CLOT|nr:CDP-diacylglycerol--glycerol-3-phosphate 3-phosphatidyltransferase [Clostridium thermobutyricum]OPX48119.1 CDP-diacylglycerol--glycerol-3-phosphate 3-phosphatidyltransferase [Clostridium thermobutyricum DSM 4928]